MGTPAIERPLVRFERDQPAHRNQLLARLLDPPQADPKGASDPRRFDASPRRALTVLEIEATQKMADDSGDQGRPGAAGQQPQGAAGDRYQAIMVGNSVQEPPESVAVG